MLLNLITILSVRKVKSEDAIISPVTFILKKHEDVASKTNT